MYGFRMRRRKTKEVLERSKNDVSISLFLVANTNFSPYRDIYIYMKKRPTRIQREYRNANSWTGLESFIVPFSTSFRGNTRFLDT